MNNTLYFGDNLDILRQAIADLLNGKTARYPDLSRGGTSFKKSKVEQAEGKQGELL